LISALVLASTMCPVRRCRKQHGGRKEPSSYVRRDISPLSASRSYVPGSTGPRLAASAIGNRRPDKVAQLEDALIKDDAAEAREGIRALIETIILALENGRLQVEVRGDLAATLSIADGAKAPS
jgi:hypothetical protein